MMIIHNHKVALMKTQMTWYLQGPSPFDGSDNNVTVSPIEIHKQGEVLQILKQEIDILKSSTDIGIDIYINAIDLVKQAVNI